LYRVTKIWEAVRATSAASSFFDPIKIGPYLEGFVDGATGANNPIAEVCNQAKDLWSLDNIEDDVQCIISIGTGVPSLKPFGEGLTDISAALVAIATETEKTAERFAKDKSRVENDGRYFRFNVLRGLEDIGLEDSAQRNAIIAVTGLYLESQAVYKQLGACSTVLQARFSDPAVEPRDSELALSVHKAVQESDMKQLERLLLDKAQINDENEAGLTPLHLACEQANIGAVKLLVKNEGINMEKEDRKGRTPLHCAAGVGNIAICSILLDKGASSSAQDFQGMHPIHYAAAAGHNGVLQILQDRSSSLINQAADYEGNTPLHLASKNGMLGAVYMLLQEKANPKLTNGSNKTALQIAQDNGHRDVADLLSFETETNAGERGGKTMLHWAAENGKPAVLTLALERREVDCKDNKSFTPLSLAASNGHAECCQLLLDRGANIESHEKKDKLTPLNLASKAGHSEVVRMLLDNNADIESKCYDDRTPLLWAARNCHEQVITILLDRKADLSAKDRNRSSALWLACLGGSIPCTTVLLNQESGKERQLAAVKALPAALGNHKTELVKFLLEEARDMPDAKEYYQRILYTAVRLGNEEIVKIMISKGADLSLEDEKGMSIFDYAIREHDLALVERLLKLGMDFRTQSAKEEVFHRATRERNIKLVELLLEKYQVDVDSPNEYGTTALSRASDKEMMLCLVRHSANINSGEREETVLHRMAQNHYSEEVSILLDYGAYIDCEDRNGATPLLLATGYRGEKTVKTLLDRGADPNAGVGIDDGKALHQAAKIGCLEMVRWLLDAGANPEEKNGYGDTALDLAMKGCHKDTIMLLNARGSGIKSCRAASLTHLITYDKKAIFELALENGANPNGADGSPLRVASGYGRNEMVNLLLQKGANVNLQDSDGYTALYQAITSARVETVKILLDAGADLKIKAENGTAFEWAVRPRESRSSKAIVDMMLNSKHGVDLNERNRGYPLLYTAITGSGSDFIVRRLIECGADTSVLARDGTNALDWVAALGNTSSAKNIKTLLMQRGLKKTGNAC
jgi:ankyrin repeat protein